MFIPSLITSLWSQILLLELLPQRVNQFQNSIYPNLWEWKTKYPSEAMNKFYYDAKTETLYPKLNRRYREINHIVKYSKINFFLNTRPTVITWGSFFYEIVYPITIFSNFPKLYQSLRGQAIKRGFTFPKSTFIKKFSRKYLKISQNFKNTREVS